MLSRQEPSKVIFHVSRILRILGPKIEFIKCGTSFTMILEDTAKWTKNIGTKKILHQEVLVTICNAQQRGNRYSYF